MVQKLHLWNLQPFYRARRHDQTYASPLRPEVVGRIVGCLMPLHKRPSKRSPDRDWNLRMVIVPLQPASFLMVILVPAFSGLQHNNAHLSTNVVGCNIPELNLLGQG